MTKSPRLPVDLLFAYRTLRAHKDGADFSFILLACCLLRAASAPPSTSTVRRKPFFPLYNDIFRSLTARSERGGRGWSEGFVETLACRSCVLSERAASSGRLFWSHSPGIIAACSACHSRALTARSPSVSPLRAGALCGARRSATFATRSIRTLGGILLFISRAAFAVRAPLAARR